MKLNAVYLIKHNLFFLEHLLVHHRMARSLFLSIVLWLWLLYQTHPSLSFRICCANCACTCAMRPKLFHIQAPYAFVSLLCVCVCGCGLYPMPCSWQRDHFGLWCFCPNSKQRAISVVPLGSEYVWMQTHVRALFRSLLLHKQHSCSFISVAFFTTSTKCAALLLPPARPYTPGLNDHLLHPTGSLNPASVHGRRVMSKDQQLARQWAANPRGVSNMGTSLYGLNVQQSHD